MTARILIVDDEKKIRTILVQILLDEGYQVTGAANGAEAITAFENFAPDIILLDQNLPDMTGTDVMEQIFNRSPGKTIIFLTAHGTITHAVEAMKRGAYDYLTKPFDNDELLMVIRRAVEHIRLSDEVTSLRRELHERYRFDNIVGESPVMRRLFDQMRRVCSTTATVLIQGESGTGKELVARAIHYASDRSDHPLVSVNCGAIPVTLIESEIFGHEKGAFTDAKEQKSGRFEQANGGTLFLDEIGELPMDAQVKLLRILEDHKVTRLGGNAAIPVDVRIIAATNKDLEQEVKAYRFRLDLLYRLNVFTLTVPPLRNRLDDIPLLTDHFFVKYRNSLGLKVESISRQAIEALERYDWPGNVRDLENAVQSAMILAAGKVVGFDDLPLRVRGYPDDNGVINPARGGLDEHVRRAAETVERDMIVTTLRANNDNRTKTAEVLGISRKTLFNKMREYGLT
jgi:DNA-binding NtrC family response regulator